VLSAKGSGDNRVLRGNSESSARQSCRAVYICIFGNLALYSGNIAKERNMPVSPTVLRRKSVKVFPGKLTGLAAELEKNTVASEIAMSVSIKAGILVDQVKSDKAFWERLVQISIIPRRTLQYAAENNMQRFTPAQSERIVRAMRVTGLAREAFGDKADEWLDRPTTVFAGATPAEMLVNEAGARAVEMFIGQAMHGFAA
jgi:putative toxin-antitoxin system antitoxin component (TIGR02293 family)